MTGWIGRTWKRRKACSEAVLRAEGAPPPPAPRSANRIDPPALLSHTLLQQFELSELSEAPVGAGRRACPWPEAAESPIALGKPVLVFRARWPHRFPSRTRQ